MTDEQAHLDAAGEVTTLDVTPLAAALGVPAEAVAAERFDEIRVSVTLTTTTGRRMAILAPADGWQVACVGPLRQWLDGAGASFAPKRPDKAA